MNKLLIIILAVVIASTIIEASKCKWYDPFKCMADEAARFVGGSSRRNSWPSMWGWGGSRHRSRSRGSRSSSESGSRSSSRSSESSSRERSRRHHRRRSRHRG